MGVRRLQCLLRLVMFIAWYGDQNNVLHNSHTRIIDVLGLYGIHTVQVIKQVIGYQYDCQYSFSVSQTRPNLQ